MEYKVIKSKEQYKQYCEKLFGLLKCRKDENEDIIELLTVLIEKYETENSEFIKLDPVQMIRAILEANNLKPKDLADILDLSKGTISKMLNYKKGLSKDTIRKLSSHFKVDQKAFNRPYELKNASNATNKLLKTEVV